ncbi:hypothetical protein [Emcibacter sp. SYSU 3D8]|uniref:hypothetical protein n=1 Tax=Emcibacter sp. SYSU 3D8 TaxID=3133969 RepID=UPI0031FE47A1
MIPSSRDLIAGIARTLEEEVLPDLATATWTASSIRSCLSLLAHLEERVVHEGRILFEDNADMRTLLGRLRTDLSEPLPEAAVAISLALDVTRPPAGYPSVADLDAFNQRLKTVLEQTITALHDGRDSLGEDRFQSLNGSILVYLAAAAERESIMFTRAGARSPL